MKHCHEAGGTMKAHARVHLAVILSFALIAISFEPRTVNSFEKLSRENAGHLAPGNLRAPIERSSLTIPTSPNSGYPYLSGKIGSSITFHQSSSQIDNKPTKTPGQTSTLLPNGDSLVIGGERVGWGACNSSDPGCEDWQRQQIEQRAAPSTRLAHGHIAA